MARQRGSRWQGDAAYQGKRMRRSFVHKADAELWEAQVQHADASGAPLAVTVKEGGEDQYLFSKFAKDHFKFIWGDNRSQSNTSAHLEQFTDVFGPNKRMADVSYNDLVEAVCAFEAQGNSNATINRKMATMSKLLKHAHKLGVVPAVPAVPRRREPVGRIRFFTKAEEALLVGRLEHFGLLEAMHMTNFLLYTGARRSEAHSVERSDVDLVRRVVTFWRTKADSPRTIPLTDKAKVAVEYFLSHDRSGTELIGLPYSTYTEQWERVRFDLGYGLDRGFIPHTLRHTCASRLVQAGVDLRRVQVYMGHKSITTTLRYAHLAPKDLEIAASALGG